jgi:hypothetical protein
MSAPAFSVFSAISELFVTAGVLYVVRRNWKRQPFPGLVLLGIVLFEASVNVLYMANRAAQAASGADPVSDTMKLFYALHGSLSLLAFVVFVILGGLAYQDQKVQRWFFRDHPVVTWVFLVAWTVSILSGEAIFVMRYL